MYDYMDYVDYGKHRYSEKTHNADSYECPNCGALCNGSRPFFGYVAVRCSECTIYFNVKV